MKTSRVSDSMGKDKKNEDLVKVKKSIQLHKEFDTLCKNWLPLAAEAAAATIGNGVLSAAFWFVSDTIGVSVYSALPFPPFKLLAINATPQSRLIYARNTGVLFGATEGLTCVVKNIRGKDDVETRMVAGFGAGVLYSMVRREPPAFTLLSLLLEGGLFKVKEKIAAGWK